LLKEQHQLYLEDLHSDRQVEKADPVQPILSNHSLQVSRCLLANRSITVATNRMNEYADGGNSGITVEAVPVVVVEIVVVDDVEVPAVDVWLVVVAVCVMVLVVVIEVIVSAPSPTYDIVLNGADTPHLLLSSCFVSRTLVSTSCPLQRKSKRLAVARSPTPHSK